MSRLQLDDRCRQVLGWLGSQVTIANAAGFTDINVVSESLIQNLFNLIEDQAAYINTNIEAPNTDSIDLADQGRRIAVQVTSNSTAAKIDKTIGTFEKNQRNKDYDVLRFLFLKPEYHPTKGKHSLAGAKVVFEDLGQLYDRIRILDMDRLQRTVELLELELAPWVPCGKTQVQLVRESVTETAESIRATCRVNNFGEFSAENVQMAVKAFFSKQVDVIPKNGWNPIPGSGEPGFRTFQARFSIHPTDSVQAILELPWSPGQEYPKPVFLV